VSASREELTIQFVVDKDEDIQKFVENETYKFYDLIYSIVGKVNNKSKNKYPKEINLFTAQDLSNMMPDLQPQDRESKLIQDEHVFILKNPGKKLFSGKRHSYIPPTLYNLNNHFNLFINETVNG